MSTIATLFSGGEGVGIGASNAGLRHLWGIEKSPAIAARARKNGFEVTCADVRNVDPLNLERPDVLHASPPCPSFSSAKVGGAETDLDVELAQATARFVHVLRPRVFTLENVWQYRNSESWRVIQSALAERGYMWTCDHLISADFSVPQTRKRMWVRAVRGAMVPYLPSPEPWQGWYAAIEDLLDDLPDDEFAPWQLERMPDELRETVLLAQGAYGDGLVMRRGGEPANTVTANQNMTSIRAFLMSATNAHETTLIAPDEPVRTVTATHPALGMRAFLAGATSNGFAARHADEPATTVLATNPRRPSRAFLVDGANARQGVPTIRDESEPSYTIAATGDKAPARAFVGRVVRLSPRCLARFQSFPDWYELPESKTLAARIIGNAVPPLQYEKIVKVML